MQTQPQLSPEKKIWIKPQILECTSLTEARSLKSINVVELVVNGTQIGPHS